MKPEIDLDRSIHRGTWRHISRFTVLRIKIFEESYLSKSLKVKISKRLEDKPQVIVEVISEGSMRRELALSRLQLTSSEIGRVGSGSH
jgi:hypothetical protein